MSIRVCRRGRYLAGAVISIMVGACTVGPDYHAPKSPPASAYNVPKQTAGGQPALPAGNADLASQSFRATDTLRQDWFRVFGSDKLDSLIQHALEHSPTLAAGRARLRAAREVVNAQKGARLPQISASAGAARKRASGIALGINNPMFINVFNLYQGQVSARYDLDLFGKTRRLIEGSQARFNERTFRVANTRITLVNNIVTTAIAEAGLNAAIDATQTIIAVQQKTLETVKKQIRLGAAIDADATQIRTRLAQTRASLEPLKKQRTIAVNRLAILSGQTPGTFDDPRFTLDNLKLPHRLPVSTPAQLVNNRPDVRAAAAAVHIASANVGVATANLLPDISITGSYGRSALSPSDLADPMTALYSLGATLAGPIFSGGRLRAEQKAARARLQAALAAYRATELGAFGEVADGLASLRSDARSLLQQNNALEAAQQNLSTVKTQRANGAADNIDVYTATVQFQRALLNYTDARVTRFRDSARLFRALGGSWPHDTRGKHIAQDNTNAS